MIKKLLVYIFVHIIILISPSISYAKNLDIGEDAKLVDFNVQCKEVLSEGLGKDPYYTYFGFKNIEGHDFMAALRFSKKNKKYIIPTSTVIPLGKTSDGYSVYIFYDLYVKKNQILEYINYLKGNDHQMTLSYYDVDSSEIEKLKRIEDNMFKEPDNKKFIELVKILTDEIAKLIMVDKSKVKKKTKLTFSCIDSELIIKYGKLE